MWKRIKSTTWSLHFFRGCHTPCFYLLSSKLTHSLTVPASTCQWITNLLTYRRRQVKLGNITSSTQNNPTMNTCANYHTSGDLIWNDDESAYSREVWLSGALGTSPSQPVPTPPCARRDRVTCVVFLLSLQSSSPQMTHPGRRHTLSKVQVN